MILDTGSSTLAVWHDKFGSTPVTKTNNIQFVGYGTGHWTGPVLKAQIGLGTGEHYIDIPDANISQIQSGIYRGQRQFYPADGILGLAYQSLNNAADAGTADFPISNYDSQYKWLELTSPQYTANPLPTVHLTPFFTELEKAELTPNKFAFMTRRSITHYSTDLATDPLNKGWFILGEGEQHTELYTGDFLVVTEVAEPNGQGRYYNTNMTAIQVGDFLPQVVEPPSSSYLLSNSIIDSGTNTLSLASNIYDYVLQHAELLAQRLGVPQTEEDLAKWPAIYVTLDGEDDSPVKLEIKPETYWQLNSVTASGGKTQFNISKGQQQSILGLPLMNNYYVVFDRSIGKTGVIKFAKPNFDGAPK